MFEETHYPRPVPDSDERRYPPVSHRQVFDEPSYRNDTNISPRSGHPRPVILLD